LCRHSSTITDRCSRQSAFWFASAPGGDLFRYCTIIRHCQVLICRTDTRMPFTMENGLTRSSDCTGTLGSRKMSRANNAHCEMFACTSATASLEFQNTSALQLALLASAEDFISSLVIPDARSQPANGELCSFLQTLLTEVPLSAVTGVCLI
jgi:hypothetical protein